MSEPHLDARLGIHRYGVMGIAEYGAVFSAFLPRFHELLSCTKHAMGRGLYEVRSDPPEGDRIGLFHVASNTALVCLHVRPRRLFGVGPVTGYAVSLDIAADLMPDGCRPLVEQVVGLLDGTMVPAIPAAPPDDRHAR